jgi:hypothetical protein
MESARRLGLLVERQKFAAMFMADISRVQCTDPILRKYSPLQQLREIGREAFVVLEIISVARRHNGFPFVFRLEDGNRTVEEVARAIHVATLTEWEGRHPKPDAGSTTVAAVLEWWKAYDKRNLFFDGPVAILVARLANNADVAAQRIQRAAEAPGKDRKTEETAQAAIGAVRDYSAVQARAAQLRRWVDDKTLLRNCDPTDAQAVLMEFSRLQNEAELTAARSRFAEAEEVRVRWRRAIMCGGGIVTALAALASAIAIIY